MPANTGLTAYYTGDAVEDDMQRLHHMNEIGNAMTSFKKKLAQCVVFALFDPQIRDLLRIAVEEIPSRGP